MAQHQHEALPQAAADEGRQEEVRRLEQRIAQLQRQCFEEQGAYRQTEKLCQMAEGREREQRLVFTLY